MTTKRTAKREYRPSGRQLDPERIKTETVQYWANGIMMSAQMTNAQARELVSTGWAFVITDQAIGRMVNGVSQS